MICKGLEVSCNSLVKRDSAYDIIRSYSLNQTAPRKLVHCKR